MIYYGINHGTLYHAQLIEDGTLPDRRLSDAYHAPSALRAITHAYRQWRKVPSMGPMPGGLAVCRWEMIGRDPDGTPRVRFVEHVGDLPAGPYRNASDAIRAYVPKEAL